MKPQPNQNPNKHYAVSNSKFFIDASFSSHSSPISRWYCQACKVSNTQVFDTYSRYSVWYLYLLPILSNFCLFYSIPDTFSKYRILLNTWIPFFKIFKSFSRPPPSAQLATLLLSLNVSLSGSSNDVMMTLHLYSRSMK